MMKPGLYEPDPLRFPLLKEALYEVLNGVLPATALRSLRLKGYKNPQGKELYLKRFMSILRCPYYAGIIKIEGWDFVNECGLHKKMIAKEEFERLQSILDGKKFKQPRKNHNPNFQLSNIMDCAECGGRLVGFQHRNGRGGSWEKYRCRTCGKMHHKEEVHGSLSLLLSSIDMSDEEVAELVVSLREVWEQSQSESFERIKLLQSRREGLLQEKRKFLLAIANNPELKGDFLIEVKSVEEKVLGVESEIQEAQNIDQDFIEFTQFALDYVRDLKGRWWELGFEDMVKCKQLLFPAGFSVNSQKKVYTSQISPIFRFKEYENESFRGSKFRYGGGGRVAQECTALRRCSHLLLGNPSVPHRRFAPAPPPRGNSRFPDPLPVQLSTSATKKAELKLSLFSWWTRAENFGTPFLK